MSREGRRSEGKGSDQGEAALGPDIGPYAREPGRGIDRRTFVKGAAAGAALGAAAAGGLGIFRQVAQVDPTIVRTVQYLGAQQSVQSPAPRGLPLIPVRVDDQGFVTGSLPTRKRTTWIGTATARTR